MAEWNDDLDARRDSDEEEDQRAAGRSRRRGRRWYQRRRKVCFFCEQKVDHIDYKQAEALQSFLTERGKIRPRRQTGTCASHQRRLAAAIKRARHLAMLPFVKESERPR